MIPAKFDYIAAKSIEEAVQLLDRHGPDARILSGGHSLIPMMKLRLATPQVLIDLSRVPDLRFVRLDGDDVVIGGLSTHRELESSGLLLERAPLVARTAARIGDVQVRNRGTMGGSLAHADPASDYPAAMLALDARMRVVGPAGTRQVKADEFFLGLMQTSLAPNEILSEICVPVQRPGEGSAYCRLEQSASGFAVVGVATCLRIVKGKCAAIRIGVVGVAPTPYRARRVEQALLGTTLASDEIKTACTAAADGVDTLSDIHASGEYRKELAAVFARRSVAAAAAAVQA